MTRILKALTGGTRLHAVLAIGLALVLSGCIGGGGDASDDEDGGDGTGGGGPPTATTRETFNEGEVVVDAKRHYHHYWDPDGEGGAPPLEKVSIFHDENRPLDPDAFRGGEFGCRSIGSDEFTLESDQDDVASGSQEAINPNPVTGDEPRADVVFAGTNMIEIVLNSVPDDAVFENDMAQIYIRYKPANLNFYIPENGCGIQLTVGEPKFIAVGRGQADPPHQWAVSRWSFFIMVANNQGGNVLPTLGQGQYSIDMWAHNGGEKNLDPAHPNLWGDEMTYVLGCVSKTDIEKQIIVWNPSMAATPAHKPPEAPLANIEWQYGRITPILTIAVEVKLELQNDAPGGFVHELYYFGADTNKYARMTLKEGSTDTYRVEYENDAKTDPPYEDSTQWRFMILPKPAQGGVPVQDEDSWVAQFEGSYNLCAMAFRDPDAVLT